jgi:hypothetical protein
MHIVAALLGITRGSCQRSGTSLLHVWACVVFWQAVHTVSKRSQFAAIFPLLYELPQCKVGAQQQLKLERKIFFML